MFLNRTGFINQLLVSVCKKQADHTCCKNSSLIFSSDFYIKVLEYLQEKKTLQITFFLGQSFAIGLK